MIKTFKKKLYEFLGAHLTYEINIFRKHQAKINSGKFARNKIDESNFTNEKAKFVSTELERLYNKVQELNQIYFTLRSKFKGDRKFARIYKEFERSGKVSQKIWLFDILNFVKNDLDDKLLLNENIIRNKSFFLQLVSQVILKKFEENQKNADFKIVKNLSQMTANEYITEYLPA
jgi:type I restriction enzyme R subunit